MNEFTKDQLKILSCNFKNNDDVGVCMNEFTKDELSKLIECVGAFTYIKGTKDNQRIYPELESKLSSMIENYCEHEFHTNPYNYILHCHRCGKSTKSDHQGKILNE